MLFFFKRVYTCSHMALSNWGDFAPLTAAHWVSVFEQGSVIDLPVLRIKAMFGYPGSDVRMVFFKKPADWQHSSSPATRSAWQ